MNKKSYILLLAIMTCSVLATISCNVGLGESIDTEPPSIEIVMPHADAVVTANSKDPNGNDKVVPIVMSGSCSDDKGLRSIEVVLKDTKISTTSTSSENPAAQNGVYNFTATISENGNEWNCIINPKDPNHPIPDGSYEATVTATDNSGRQTKQTKSFTIDNTPPLLVLERPSGILDNGKINTANADGYGSKFILEGQVGDDNNASLIELYFYSQKEDGSLSSTPINEEPICVTGIQKRIQADVFTYSEDSVSPYNKIYEYDGNKFDPNNPQTKYFAVEMRVYDEASLCSPDEESETYTYKDEAGVSHTAVKGNMRSYFYLNDDVSMPILNNEDVRVSGAYQMENGRYLISNPGNTEIQDKTLDVLNNSRTFKAALSLNPANQPEITIGGMTALSDKKDAKEKNDLMSSVASDNVVLNNTTLSVTMKMGLDKNPLVKDSLGIYLLKCSYDGTKFNYNDTEGNRIWLIKPTKDYKLTSNGKDIFAVSDSEKNARNLIEKQGSYYSATIFLSSDNVERTLLVNGSEVKYTLPPIETGSSYLVFAVGKDQDENPFVNTSGSGDSECGRWGFFFAASNAAPRLVTNISGTNVTVDNNSVYVKKDSKITVSGTVKADEKTTVYLALKDGDKLKKIDSIAEWNTPTPTYNGNFAPISFDISEVKAFDSAKGGNYEVYVVAKISEILYATQVFYICYDVEAPTVEISAIYPSVEKWNHDSKEEENPTVNGKITISASCGDANSGVDTKTKKPTIEIFKSDQNKTQGNLIPNCKWDYESVMLKAEANTLDFGVDKTYLLVKVTAYDKCGNKTEHKQLIYLDQESDRPRFTSSDLKKSENETLYKFPKLGQVAIILEDDDGLDKLTISVLDKNGNLYSETAFTNPVEYKEAIGKTYYSLNHTVPNTVGEYKLRIDAKDNTGLTAHNSIQKDFAIKVVPDKPTIQIDTGVYYGKAGGTVTVSGNASGNEPLVIKRYNTETDKTEIDKIEEPSGNWKDESLTVPADAKSKTDQAVRYSVVDYEDQETITSFKYTVDNDKPIVSINKNSGILSIETSSYTFTGASSDEISGIAELYTQVVKRGENPNGEWLLNESTTSWLLACEFYEKNNAPENYDKTKIFEEGSYTLWAKCVDRAGNESDPVKCDFDVVLGKPKIEIDTYYADGTNKDKKINVNSSKTYLKDNFYYKFKVCDTNFDGSEGTVITNNSEYVTVTLETPIGSQPVPLTTTDNGTETPVTLIDGKYYKVPLSFTSDGEYKIVIKAKDPAFPDDTNKMTTSELAIIRDTTAPNMSNLNAKWGKEEESAQASHGYYCKNKNTLTFNIPDISDDGSGVSKVYYAILTDDEKGGNITSASHIPQSKWNEISKNASFSTTLSDTNGSTIYVKAEDEVGNIGYASQIDYKVDTVPPIVEVVDPALNGAYVGYTDGLKIKVKATDENGSGMHIASDIEGKVYVTFAGSTDPIPAIYTKEQEVGYWIAKIDKGKINDSMKTAKFEVYAIDIAGNEATKLERTVNFDREKPSIIIQSHPNNSIVYDTITLSGTASDNQGLAECKVYREAKTGETGETGIVDGKTLVSLAHFTEASAYSWEATVNTRDLHNEATLKDWNFYIKATDSSRNTETKPITLKIDQDEARPTVKINSLEFGDNMAEQSEASRIWLYGDSLSGAIRVANGKEIDKAEYKIGNGNTWNQILDYSNFAVTNLNEGENSLYFKVQYKDDTTPYTSQENYDIRAVKLVDSKGVEYGKREGADKKTSVVHFTVDTKTPTVDEVWYRVKESDQWKQINSNDNSIVFGGTKHPNVYLRVKASDQNGIQNVSARLSNSTNANNQSLDEGNWTLNGDYYESTASFDMTKGNGSYKIEVSAQDLAGRHNEINAYNVYLDNEGPKIAFGTASNQQVKGTQNLFGSTENLIGNNDKTVSLYYKVLAATNPSWENSTHVTGGIPSAPEFGNDWEKYLENSNETISTWSIRFGGNTTETGNVKNADNLNTYISKLYGDAYKKKFGRELNADLTSTKADEIYKYITPLYIYIKAVDSMGNVGTSSVFVYNVDPQGDRPDVSISNPLEGDNLAGVIKMFGSFAVDGGSGENRVSVTKVIIQIDPSYSGTFNNNWHSELKDLWGNEDYDKPNLDNDKHTISSSSSDDILSSIGGFGIIKTIDNSLYSWDLSVSASSLIPENVDKSNVAVRVYAVASNGKISDPKEIHFTVLKDVPVFGGQERLRLYQYKNNETGTGVITASREYERGMWVTGKWWLSGSVEHSDGIDELTVNGTDIKNYAGTEQTWGTTKTTKGYIINYPLNTGTGAGNERFDIVATKKVSDSSPKSTTQTIDINYDNIAPRANNDNISAPVQNSDGYYRLSGTVTEYASESSFGRAAFYFTRKLENKEYIYDPMIASKRVEVSTLKEQNGLLCFEAAIVVDDTNKSKFKVTNMDNDIKGSIRKRSLVFIDGASYLIENISEDYFYVDGTLLAGENKAYFAIAQIVDNPSEELGSSGLIRDDDGDGMCENFRTVSTTTTWNAYINSRNIPDGKVDIHVVVFDAAGNYSKDEKTDYMVSNNAPRIAGVRIATDLNGNGKLDDNEFIQDWTGLQTSAMYSISGASYKTDLQGVNIGSSVPNSVLETISNIGYNSMGKINQSIIISKNEDGKTPAITIRGDTWIFPTVVGGNGSLKYNYDVKKAGLNDSYYKHNDLIEFVNAVSTENGTYGVTYNKAINFTLKDAFLNNNGTRNIDDDNDTSSQTASFKIWDNSEGLKQGENSQYVDVQFIFRLKLQDNEAPTVKINKFHWNSASDNSLYENNAKNGHIELEDELPSGLSGYTAGAPKVSGKIVIDGTAHDNNMIRKLKFSYDSLVNEVKDVANYDENAENGTGKFSIVNDINVSTPFAEGWNFEIIKNEFTQEGHTVDFKLYIDTEKIAGVTGLNKFCKIIAEDRGSPSYNGSTLSYENGKPSVPENKQSPGTGCYIMDVVPYITKVNTRISGNAGDEFARSALGKYSVSQGEVVTLEGFNLGGAVSKASINGTSITSTRNGLSSIDIPIGTNTTSGRLEIAVGASDSYLVYALNNKNSNPVFGSDGQTVTKYEYNSKANGINNNLLTDDVEFVIWNMDYFISHTDITSPMMKMDSAGKYYMSYGYGTPSMYVNKNGSTTQVDYSYNKFHNTNVGYDESGNIYAVATNTDRINDSSAKFVFYTNVSCSSSTSAYTSSSSSKRHLEMVYNNNTKRYDINRVKRPKFVVTGKRTSNSDPARVYMGYFDANNTISPVKFRYGTLTSNTSITGGIAGNTANSSSAGESNNPSTTDSSASGYHIVASNNTKYKGGEYVAVGIVPKDVSSVTTDAGVAVIAWYDAYAKQLVYSYNEDPENSQSATEAQTGGVWQTNAKVIDSSTAGWYVDMCVDKKGGIHIAYYNSGKGDLKYAYLSNYKAAPDVRTVDSYLSTGTNITINVKEENGKYVPYISYFFSSFTQTPSTVRIAWQNDMTSVKDGVVNDRFTGAWECMTIPTENVPVDGIICNGLPTTSDTYKDTPVLGYMSDRGYEKAYIKK